MLQGLVDKWRKKADELDEENRYNNNKWFGAMNDQEQKKYIDNQSRAYIYRICANDLDKLVKIKNPAKRDFF